MKPRVYLGIAFVLIGFFWDSISGINIDKPVIPSTDYNKMLDSSETQKGLPFYRKCLLVAGPFYLIFLI
jgi:hypothetical protein